MKEMKGLWESAKKQYYLGMDTVLKKTGLKNEPEDINFLNQWEKLQNTEISTMNIYKSISDLTNASQNLCEVSVSTSTSISSSFDSSDVPNFENSQKTVSYLTDCQNYFKTSVWDEVNEKCLAPLRTYMNEIMKLKNVSNSDSFDVENIGKTTTLKSSSVQLLSGQIVTESPSTRTILFDNANVSKSVEFEDFERI